MVKTIAGAFLICFLVTSVGVALADDEEDFQVNTPVYKLQACGLTKSKTDLADFAAFNVALAYISPPTDHWAKGTTYSKSQVIIDSANNLEVVSVQGQSGPTEPTWQPVNQMTTDNTVTWINVGPFNATKPVPPTDLKSTIDFLKPLVTSGELKVDAAQTVINNLVNYANDCKNASDAVKDSRVTLIHVVRWANSDHTAVKFQKWYVFDPKGDSARRYTFTSAKSQFEGTAIAGRRSYRLIYIHLNFSFTGGDEGLDSTGKLKPFDYKIAISKQQRQFVKDLQTVLKMVVSPAGVESPQIGRFSVFNFDSAFDTSTITVTASLLKSTNPPNATQNPQSDSKTTTTANAAYTRAYTNEGPFPWGLSIAIPLASYKDITVDSSTQTLQPKTVNRQNVYVALDYYLPSVVPSYTQFRYLPHPFFAMPIKGQVLRNTMAGFGVGIRWVEPFGGIVFDDQTRLANGKSYNHMVFKGAWGLKISVDAAYKKLTSSTSSTKGSGSKSASSN